MWALGTIALAYIKLDALSSADPEIDKWLGALADQVAGYFKERRKLYGGTYLNIDFWTGLAIGAAGMAVEERTRPRR